MEKHLEHLRAIHYLIIGVATVTLSFGLSAEQASQLEYTIGEVKDLKRILSTAEQYWQYLDNTTKSKIGRFVRLKEVDSSFKTSYFYVPTDTTFGFPYKNFSSLTTDELLLEFNRTRTMHIPDTNEMNDLAQAKMSSACRENNYSFMSFTISGKFDLFADNFSEKENSVYLNAQDNRSFTDNEIPFISLSSIPCLNWAEWLDTNSDSMEYSYIIPTLPPSDIAPNLHWYYYSPSYPTVWATIADLPIEQAIANLENRKEQNESQVEFIGISVSSKMFGFFIPLVFSGLLGYFFVNTQRSLDVSGKHEIVLVPYFGIYPGVWPTLFTWITLVILPLLAMLLVMFRFDHFLSDVFVTITQTVCLISSVYFGLQAIRDLNELKKQPVKPKQDQHQPSDQQPYNRRRRRPQRPHGAKPSA